MVLNLNAAGKVVGAGVGTGIKPLEIYIEPFVKSQAVVVGAPITGCSHSQPGIKITIDPEKLKQMAQ
jgi:hypothetical protein